MSRYMRSIVTVLALVAACAISTPSSVRAQDAGAAAAGATNPNYDALVETLKDILEQMKSSTSEDSESTGECSNPRAAVHSLLYWLQDEQFNPGNAAACFDTRKLGNATLEAPQLAEDLKKVLDGRNLWVVMEKLSDNNGYKDKAKVSRFDLFPDNLGGIAWARNEQGLWLLTPESLKRIPELYRETFPWDLQNAVDLLPSWFRYRFMSVELWQILGILFLLLVARILRMLLVAFITRYVNRWVKRLDAEWMDRGITRCTGPLSGFVVAGILWIGLPILQLNAKVLKLGYVVVHLIAAGSLVWLGFRIVDMVSDVFAIRAEKTESKLDDQLVPLVRKSLKMVVAVIGGIFVLQNLDVDVGSLLAGLGLGGLAFALAAKDTVANFFGSLMIFIDKPFQVGDAVKIGTNVEGTVEEVGFRTSRVRTYYNSVMTVPNALVTNSTVDNMGMRQYRRYKTVFGLTYDTKPEKVQAFCEGVRAIIQATEGMRQDYYVVEFQGFGASSLDILMNAFTMAEDYNTDMRIRSHLNLQILRLAEGLGVCFAFPSHSLYVESMPGEDAESDGTGTQPGQLAGIVEAFGPGGDRSTRHQTAISGGYDASPIKSAGGDED
jgi:MscS family membrane protein